MRLRSLRGMKTPWGWPRRTLGSSNASTNCNDIPLTPRWIQFFESDFWFLGMCHQNGCCQPDCWNSGTVGQKGSLEIFSTSATSGSGALFSSWRINLHKEYERDCFECSLSRECNSLKFLTMCKVYPKERPFGPAGALWCRLLHRNGNFVSPAQWIRTRQRVKTDFWQKTHHSRTVWESILKVPTGKTKGPFCPFFGPSGLKWNIHSWCATKKERLTF